MNTGVISLLILPFLTIQVILSMAGAQVALDNVGGLNFGQGLSQFDMAQAQAQAQAQAMAQVGVQGIAGVPGIPSYYPPIYPPSYPVIDDYSFYGPGIISTIIRAIRNCIARVLTIPWRIIRFIKGVIFYLLGINDYYPYYQYPSDINIGTPPCMLGAAAGAGAGARAQVMKREAN